MLTLVTLLKRHHVTKGEGDRDFWTELGAEYLAKLTRGVQRHVPQLTRMVCLTDSPECLPAGVEAVPIVRPEDPAWWNKLQMFAPGVASGRCLYLDLDNVLAGSIDELLALEGAPCIMTDDELQPGLANGSTMLFTAEAMHETWWTYLRDPIGTQQRFSVWPNAADQAFIAWHLGGVPLFQPLLWPGYVRNARFLETGAAWETARLVFGCSMPKPHQSLHPFYRRHWT